jgi:hypothetical protein
LSNIVRSVLFGLSIFVVVQLCVEVLGRGMSLRAAVSRMGALVPVMVLSALTIALAGSAWSRRHARMRTVEVIRRFRRAELCPSCCYDLRSIEPEGDGCAVCPECGAAWWKSAAAGDTEQ